MKKILLSLTLFSGFFLSSAQWVGNTNLTPGTTGVRSNIATLPDGAGGMFLVWDDTRNAATTGTDIFAQRISNTGTLLWTAAGVQACNTAGNQTGPVLCSDGAGGILLAWTDAAGNQDIYLQRISSAGALLYGAGGLAFSANATNLENRPTLAAVNSTEAMLMFADNRTGNVDVYANKITIATGAKAFAPDLAVCIAANTQTSFSMAADGSGGAYMAWQDPRINTMGADIFVDRLNNGGTLATGGNGVNLTPNTSGADDNQATPYCINDGSGNLLITWSDQRNGNNNGDIYVQKLNSALVEQWTAKGLSICNAAGVQSNPYIVSDGANGLIATWSDQRVSTTDRNVYAQRVNSLGVPQWAPVADGVAVCTAIGNQPGLSTQSDIFIVTDSSGGAVIAWADVRNGAATGNSSNMDIYAQKINSTGAVLWAANGLDLIDPTGNGHQRQPVLVNGGGGNILATWIDSRTTANGDIYGVKIMPDGILPLQFLGITGAINNNSIRVSFNTAQEQNLANLIIEKSADGTHFSNLTQLPPNNNLNGGRYEITDANPLKGNNYYRIKAIDKDGTVHYSAIALVRYDQKVVVSIKLFPNPAATANVLLSVTNTPAGKYAIVVTDLAGRNVAQLKVEIGTALFTRQVKIAGTGIFFLRVLNEQGEMVWGERVVRE